ncbi:fatty acid desaturase [Hahella sp. SMD15-11]|uniref:Fatty acid desaturase n=1 Tax=Thermohahella caldifontis TaxID=3142973 RepID=A0AB39UVB5_9GAMM
MSILEGLLGLSPWQVAITGLIAVQITILSITLYLHRHSAHNALELHPVLSHFFRFWLWLTTGQNTREWTAIHRKHHARCETDEDPHSPVAKGIWTVLSRGYELYKAAATPETLERYGKGTPDDWIERNVYSRYPTLGVVLLLGIDLLLFGVYGITLWAVQMLWVPIHAAGIINGLGHWVGYRNFETADNARNLIPWGLWIGGEELHNNHHAYPNSARLSVKRWEVDIGWLWIRLFQMLGLARPRFVAPVATYVPGRTELTEDTLAAIHNHRYEILARFRKQVYAPMVKQRLRQLSSEHVGAPLRRLKKQLLSFREVPDPVLVAPVLESDRVLDTLWQARQALLDIWMNRKMGYKAKLEALHAWCQQAEASGVETLEEFVVWMKGYTLSPRTA